MTEQEKYQVVKEFGDNIIHDTEFFQTYYNPKTEEVLFVLPNSSKGTGEQKLRKPLLNENGWIRKIKFLYEEFPTKDSGFHLVSTGSKEDTIQEEVVTTTIAPEALKKEQCYCLYKLNFHVEILEQIQMTLNLLLGLKRMGLIMK
jgi:hypothetical protein